MQFTLHQLLKAMIDNAASDLHITTDSPPQLRIDGELVPLKTDTLNPVETKQLCYSILTDAQKMRFEEDQELDLSFGVKDLARFRANIFMQRGAVAGAFRLVPFKIRTLDELGLPPVVHELCEKPRGLVLVTGPTGSGKSTTLASMIDQINSDAARAHRHHRGPDRVPALPQELRGQPARDRLATRRTSSARSSTSCARTRTWC